MIRQKKAAEKSTADSIAAPKGTKKATNPQVLKGIGTLPENMRLSDDELSMVTRLLRVTREKKYWLSGFIQWCLLEAYEIGPDQYLKRDYVADRLKDLSGIYSWRDTLNDWKNDPKSHPLIESYGHYFFPGRVVDDGDSRSSLAAAVDSDEEDQFRELVKLWRKDHPAPEPKRMQAPAGHLGREESGD